jgi:hypothetical protein
MAETSALLADEVLPEQPLRQWVLSLPMALRFLLATRPAVLSEVLGVVYRTISGHLLARAGVKRVAGHTGAVTLIQRFGSALNLNVHFHMLFVDGVYVTEGSGAPVFRAVRSPGAGELRVLVQRLAEGIGRLLEKRGLIERDAESAWLSGEPVQAGSLDELIGHCITWRIAAGPRAGQKVFTLQTVAAQGAEQSGLPRHVAMRWAQRLKRVFGIEIESCVCCGTRLKIMASIEDPGVIARILAHRDRASDRPQEQRVLHAARAPPGQSAV